MNTSLSIFARALASENISFSFNAEAETASFDVKNRHLVMPVWNVSEVVQTMLIAHEISHALWTPYDRSEVILNAAEKKGFHIPTLQRIANVIEDVRIEKLMKAKYPGTRRDFFLGYKEIIDADLFKFKGKDFSNANIVTRLNLHFKWGVPGFLPIDLTPEEIGYAKEINAAQTIDDVYAIAKRLYKHPTMQEQPKSQTADKKADGKGDAGEVAGDLSDIPGNGKGRNEGTDYGAMSITITGLKDCNKAIIGTDFLLKSLEDANQHCPLDLKDYRQFVKDSDAFVRQLVAQFERKKAADEIRRERPKQTGMLNLDRLHQYRTHDDIFLSKIVKQEGKNHGIVFMLDFSGSMCANLKDCFLQVLQLVWFCEKAKIPFEVFGYTDIHPVYQIPDYADYRNANGHSTHPDLPQESRDCPNMMLYGQSRLINLASSRDDAAKRERLLAFLYGVLVQNSISGCGALRLHGTPTVECVAIASQFMQEWVKANNIQIPTLMVVTDGQANGICVKDHEKSGFYSHYNIAATLTVVNEITDTVHRVQFTEQDYDLSNNLIRTMLDSLRTKINARLVGMFVGPTKLTERDYVNFCMSRNEKLAHWQRGHGANVTGSARFKAAQESYKEGTVIVHPDCYPGYDAYFLVRTPKIVKDADAITEGNFTKVKNAFIKTMGNRSASRVFLTRYVDIVAGQPIAKLKDTIYGIPC